MLRPRQSVTVALFSVGAILFLLLTTSLAGDPLRLASLYHSPPRTSPVVDPVLIDLQARTFRYFWDTANPKNGLIPDRFPTPSFASIAAVGFALTAYPVGVERGYVKRKEARKRVLTTLRFLRNAPQGHAAKGMTGYKGFFYHFIDMKTGQRFEESELSTVDTAILLAGALFCQSYFDRPTATERRIVALVDSMVTRADWEWMRPRPPLISLGWKPEGGFLEWDWRGYNETLIVFLLALGSPTHAVGADAYRGYTGGYTWGTFHDQEYLGFAPLFGHQYTHVWVDFRGIRDEYMRGKGIDYFENTRRATYAQRAYAMANPSGYKGYGADVWGLTACDGPLDGKLTLNGREREFHTYEARGACHTRVTDDGTIAPTAAGGSLPFAPEICLPALMAMRERYGEPLFGRYGFVDAFNPTLDVATRTPQGRVVPGLGWFDTDYLGIDQGPILAMIENWRSGLVWRVMRKNAHLRRGLLAAGFRGGWLEGAEANGTGSSR